jgi:hypothetical protein
MFHGSAVGLWHAGAVPAGWIGRHLVLFRLIPPLVFIKPHERESGAFPQSPEWKARPAPALRPLQNHLRILSLAGIETLRRIL